MPIQKSLFSLLLISLLAWVAWYAWTLTQTANPDASPGLRAVEQAEDLGYAQCISVAQREYQVNSDNGLSDPGQTLFTQMNAKIEACNQRYGRK